MFQLKSEPQSLRHLVSDGYGLFRQTLLENIAAGLLLVGAAVVGFIILAFIPGGSKLEHIARHGPDAMHATHASGSMLGFIFFLLLALVLKIIWAAIIKSNWNVGSGQAYQLGATLSESFSKIIPLITNIIVFVFILGVLVVLYAGQLYVLHGGFVSGVLGTVIAVAFFYVAITYGLMVPALMIGDEGYGSFKAAFALIRGNWWRTLIDTNLSIMILYMLVVALPILVAMCLLAPSAIPILLKAAHSGALQHGQNLPLPGVYTFIFIAVYVLAAISLVVSVPGLTGSVYAVLYNDLALRNNGGSASAEATVNYQNQTDSPQG